MDGVLCCGPFAGEPGWCVFCVPDSEVQDMARLTAAQRRKLPASDFAGPDRSFPINDAAHAKAAKSLERFASPATKARINKMAASKGVGKAKPKAQGKKK